MQLRAGHGAERDHGRRRRTRSSRSITSFALYGFPESHAASFALLAYASAYLKALPRAAFTCALLNNQPMGFYHPFTLVKDAQRHGVRFRAVDVTRSDWNCALEDGRGAARACATSAGLRKAAAERLVRGARARARVRVAAGPGGPRRAAPRRAGRAGRGRRAERLRPHAPQRAVAGGARGAPAGPAASRDADGAADPSPLPEMTLPERLHTRHRGHRVHHRPAPDDRRIARALAARGIKRAWDLQAWARGRASPWPGRWSAASGRPPRRASCS